MIGATSTVTGLLAVRAELDTDTYPIGVKYTKKQVEALLITHHDFHGKWTTRWHPRQPTRRRQPELFLRGP